VRSSRWEGDEFAHDSPSAIGVARVPAREPRHNESPLVSELRREGLQRTNTGAGSGALGKHPLLGTGGLKRARSR